MDAVALPKPKPIRMRGRSYVAFVFYPVVPIMGWLEEVDATLRQSPGFFAGKPVVLDLSALDLTENAIAQLVANFEQRNLRILGIEGVDAARLTASLPPLLNGGRHCVIAPNAPKKPEVKPKPASLLLDTQVRSGQSVVFPEGDITVVGSVSSGAEIVAGGSIHVYGKLRGRAIAGQAGRPAQIFCGGLDAELLSINRVASVADNMCPRLRGRAVRAWHEQDVI